MIRVYCWRVGMCFNALENGNCPECGSNSHLVWAPATCGDYAPYGNTGKGYPCDLEIGHAGPHRIPLAVQSADALEKDRDFE
jgi:hypothetical protein